MASYKGILLHILRHDIPFLTRWTKSPPCWSSYCRCQRVTVGMTRSCGQCMSIVGGLGTYSCHLPTGLCFFNLKLPVQRPNWLALWTEHGLSNSIQVSKFMPTIWCFGVLKDNFGRWDGDRFQKKIGSKKKHKWFFSQILVLPIRARIPVIGREFPWSGENSRSTISGLNEMWFFWWLENLDFLLDDIANSSGVGFRCVLGSPVYDKFC